MYRILALIVTLSILGCNTVQDVPEEKPDKKQRTKEEYCSVRDKSVDPELQNILCR